MTDSNDTRPISVAELLAKNGTIGAPVSGRRRRRRGNSDAVTVAELTGEIPVIKVHTYGPDAVDEAESAEAEPSEPAVTDAATETDAATADTVEPHAGDAEVLASHGVDGAEAADVDVDAEPTDLDSEAAHPVALHKPSSGAEEMSPDPIDDEDVVAEDDDDLRAVTGVQPAITLDEPPLEHGNGAAPGYAELFGGQGTAADTAADEDAATVEHRDEHGGSPFMRGAWVVGQSVLAVAFGAGMFFAFDQLWRWNMIVALVLSVLVILGLVVGVRVVRKTDDLASTLTAVVVGALVTFGPLALLTSQ
ncbi:hypothetical protein ABIA30_001914 [Mycobacterium sp. MAA66]|uniref:hypothetical protein n=1 Tax=Mycobacterium sp. MAA66 TaxID=3156297 RepID=UPI0035117BF3